MASVVTDPNGFKRVVFKGLDGKRRPLRLGKCSEKDAIAVAGHVEEIINAAVLNRAVPRATAEWLAGMPLVMGKKLVAVGLIHPRDESESITLRAFLDAYLARRSDVKDGTMTFYGHTRRNLLDVFGADRPLPSITPGDADDFRRALQPRGDDPGGAKQESDTLGVKLFDVAAVLLKKSGRAARGLKARWLTSPKLPKPIGQIYQSRRCDLYSLDKIMAFIRQTDAEPADGWDAIASRLRPRQLKAAGNAKRGLSAVTVARRCGLAKQFFRDAVRRKLIPSNPFDDVGGGPKANAKNAHFIDLDTIQRVIDECPNAEWRLLVALSRFDGLRVPSEPCLLRWCDIDWSENRMTVTSPKTEHHAGKETRVVPLFTDLLPYLEAVFDQAAEGAEFVLDVIRRSVNPGTRFEKIIKRSGVTTWPRLWHNLRSSRQTELTESFPAHVVNMWLGNSERIAEQHYLQVLESHFQKAACIPARGTPASGRFETHRVTENAKTLGNSRVLVSSMGDEGLEPPTSTV